MLCAAVASFVVCSSQSRGDDAESLLRNAAASLAENDLDGALKAATASLAEYPNASGYRLRAVIQGKAGRHAEAIADLDEGIKLAPKSAALYAQRGNEHFLLAKFKESVADYDKQIELSPGSGPGHWQRGISCYYAGQYAEGAKQFAAYHAKVDDNDVENSIWRCMCMARESSLEKARQEMLVVKHDDRVAMMEAYEMFAGKAEPAAVLKAAEADGSPAQLNQQRFYANLYVGLFCDITSKTGLAKKHLHEALKHRIDHPMWDVARVQAELLDKRD